MSEKDSGELREGRLAKSPPHAHGSPSRSGSRGSHEAESSGRRTPPIEVEGSVRRTPIDPEGSGRRTPPIGASPSDSWGRRGMVGNIILQAAQQAQQEEQAQATARTAAQIAAQARKMRSRSRRVMPEMEQPELYPEGSEYDMESGMRASSSGHGAHGMRSEGDTGGHDVDYGEAEKATPTAKDIRGQTLFHSDGKTYNLPMPPAFALLDIGKPGRRLGQKWALFKGPLEYRICLWTAIVLTALAALFGLSLLVAYLALDPKPPKYELEEIRVQWWMTYKDTTGFLSSPAAANTTATPTVYLYSDVIMVTRVENPNKALGVQYYNTTFDISYQGTKIGHATVPPHFSAASNSSVVTAEWKCDACAVLNVGHYLEADQAQGAVPLNIKMTVDASVELHGIISPAYRYSTLYNIKISPPPKADSQAAHG